MVRALFGGGRGGLCRSLRQCGTCAAKASAASNAAMHFALSFSAKAKAASSDSRASSSRCASSIFHRWSSIVCNVISFSAVLYISIVCLSSSRSLFISASISSCTFRESLANVTITKNWVWCVRITITTLDEELSKEAEENSFATELRGDCIISKFRSKVSDIFDNLGGKPRSVLGLPVLTNDMSLSGIFSPPILDAG